jgi:hypothetical protein
MLFFQSFKIRRVLVRHRIEVFNIIFYFNYNHISCLDTFHHYLKIIVQLAEHQSSKCRQKALEIVCRIYEIFKPDGTKLLTGLEKSIHEICRLCLAKGKKHP